MRAPRTAEQEAALQAEVLKCVSPGTYRAHKQGLAARDGMVAQFAARRDEVSGAVVQGYSKAIRPSLSKNLFPVCRVHVTYLLTGIYRM